MSNRELLTEFKAWRQSEGLGFNNAFVPKTYADMQTLEHEYWLLEQAAADQKKEAGTLPPPTPVTKKATKKPKKRSSKGFEEAVADMLGEVFARLKTLEGREARPHYRGVYRSSNHYSVDETVTHDGGMWVCLRPSQGAKPGKCAPGYWKLAVKAGDGGTA